MRLPFNTLHRQSGVSYVEVLAAVIIIALTVIPATNAIRSSMNVAEIDSQATVNHYRLTAKMEEVLAESFSALSGQALGQTTATTYSDALGSADRRIVYIATYDGDNADSDNDPFTGTDSDLLWIRVQIEGGVDAIQALKIL